MQLLLDVLARVFLAFFVFLFSSVLSLFVLSGFGINQKEYFGAITFVSLILSLFAVVVSFVIRLDDDEDIWQRFRNPLFDVKIKEDAINE